MIALRALAGIFVLGCMASAQVIVDTDAGSDDFIAIAVLLANDQPIEAITVVNGMAHVEAGTRNMRRLLDVAGRTRVPVFAGRSRPLRGNREFPSDWRKSSDDLPGVYLPTSRRPWKQKSAATYLLDRLRHAEMPVRILALGPLTNIAEALELDRSIVRHIRKLIIMGGAVRVPGNTPDARAEWNMFIDPFAAQVVLRSGIPIQLIPLDATNKVPLGPDFVRDFRRNSNTAVGRLVSEVLETDRATIAAGSFYAWDPLAATALLNPTVVRTVAMHISVDDDGRTIPSQGAANANVAMDADAHLFGRIFLNSFSRGAPGP